MVKALFFACALLISSRGVAFAHLPKEYLIEIGNPHAKQALTEYFSLSCPACLKLIREDFPPLFKEHIQKGEIFWTFHPDPQDLTTLRFLACLEKMGASKRFPFFWDTIHLVDAHATKRNCFLLQELSKQYGNPMPALADLGFLEQTGAAKVSLSYLQQEGIPEQIPALEKNGKLLIGFPSFNQMKELL